MTSNHASIVVTVTPVNDTPVAVNDNYTTKQGTAFNGDLLANDTDVEGDRLTATITAQPTNGKLVLYANGTFTYTPKPSFSGSDNFTYYVCDSGLPKACSNTATATISVGPVPIIGLAKSVSAPKLELNGSYSLTYTVTVENFGNIPLEDINITDDLTKAFSVPTQFSVNGGIRTTGNLVADVAFDGRTNTMLLSSGSLPVGGVEIITYMVNVLPNLNFGTFYSNVVGTATCSTRDVTTDKSTNGLDADPGNDKNPEESELTPVTLTATNVFIPGGFSPNNDGVNDKFIIENAGNERISLEVYNRWGNLVYKNVDYKNDWDGVSNQGIRIGDGIPDGTYYYIAIINGKEKLVSFITINR